MDLTCDSCIPSDINLNVSRKVNHETVSLIYLNSKVSIDEPVDIIERLKTVVDFVVRFIDIDAAVSYATSIKKEKVIMVVFGLENILQILSEVQNLRQVDSVFVLRDVNDNQNALEHEKIVAMCDCLDDLLLVLQKNVELIEKHLSTFNFFHRHQRSIRDLSAEYGEFLWFQLIKDTLMKMPHDEEAKIRFIDSCRSYYRGNRKQLMLIEDYDRSYQSNEAIQWYTRPSFLYKLVNKALRTEDVEQLDIFRFFICDLRVCLAREHKLLREFGGVLTLYRGAKLLLSELEMLRSNSKTLISTNGFLSTSRSRSVAEMFVSKSLLSVDTVPVIFEIDCDVDSLGGNVIFADVSYLSNVRDEYEILFDLGVTFCIDTVVAPNQHSPFNAYLIKMHATTEGFEIVREYINENRISMNTTNVRVIFGKLLMDMGRYEIALRYFKKLVQENEFDDLVWVYINLGSVYRCLGQYADAKAQYALAYDLCTTAESPRYRDAASIIDNLGVIWDDTGRIDEALDCHKFAYKIRMEFLGSDHNDTGTSLINIGSIYFAKHYYEHALNCYLRALEIKQDCLPSNHPDTAEVISAIGTVYMRVGDYEGALEYLPLALIMQEQSLPALHSSISNTLQNLGCIYYELEDYDKALHYFSRSLKITEACVSANHKNFANTLDNIGSLYFKTQEYDQALDFKLRALRIRESVLPNDHPDITISLLNVSKTYFNKGVYNLAFEYGSKALSMQQRFQLMDLVTFGKILKLLADVFFRQREYNQSLEYHLRLLDVLKESLSTDHRLIASTLNSIGLLHEYLGKMNEALEYHVNALVIYSECLPDKHPDRTMAQRCVTRTKLLSDRKNDIKISRSSSATQNLSETSFNSNINRRKSFG